VGERAREQTAPSSTSKKQKGVVTDRTGNRGTLVISRAQSNKKRSLTQPTQLTKLN